MGLGFDGGGVSITVESATVVNAEGFNGKKEHGVGFVGLQMNQIRVCLCLTSVFRLRTRSDFDDYRRSEGVVTEELEPGSLRGGGYGSFKWGGG